MIKSLVKSIINSTRFFNKYYSGIATIFMLHRIAPFENNKLIANENMKVSPEFLENFILNLKQKGYNFISLDRLFEILKNNESTKKQILFTLDDGYVDNFNNAYPIFKKYKVPFTIYLSTSYIERNAIVWWSILEDLIINNDEIILFDNEKYLCNTIDSKTNTFFKIREKILNFDNNHFLEKITVMFNKYNINLFDKCNELFMNWDMVKQLSCDKLVTIAGHTTNHHSLNRLKEKEVVREIVDANKLIEAKTGKKVEHFAYPFGSNYEVGQREFDIVKKLGIKTATTTRYGNIYKEHSKSLECLPRVILTENFSVKDFGKIRRKKVVTL